MQKKINELEVAITGIKLAILSMGISLALSIVPLSLSILKPELQEKVTIGIIIFYGLLALLLILVASRINIPKINKTHPEK